MTNNNISDIDISIIIPTFNRVEFLGAAIHSVLSEIDLSLDIIIVDDGSTDDTRTLVEGFMGKDNRIRYFLTSHCGVAEARNVGLRHAIGRYIGFLDSDDLNFTGRLARQMMKLDRRPDIAAVVGIRDYFENDAACRPEVIGKSVRRNIDICLGSTLFRADIFKFYGLFDPSLTFGEDLDLFFRLLEAHEIFIIETETAVHYRLHNGNMTKDVMAMHRALLRAHHNSMVRRRAQNRTDRIDVFFFRTFLVETEFGGMSSTLPLETRSKIEI